jgi:hypothetical protein
MTVFADVMFRHRRIKAPEINPARLRTQRMRNTSHDEDIKATLSIRSSGGVLRVRLMGETQTHTARLACWREIAAAARAADCHRLLLIDREYGTHVGVAELAELALLLRAEASHFERIAVVEPARGLRTTMSHGEHVARALGIPVRLFETERAAKAWLRKTTD